MKIEDINVYGATQANFNKVKFEPVRVERFGKCGLLLQQSNGMLYGARLESGTYSVKIYEAGLLDAMTRMGIVTRADVKRWQQRERTAAKAQRLRDDARQLQRLLGRCGTKLSKSQLAAIRKSGREPAE